VIPFAIYLDYTICNLTAITLLKVKFGSVPLDWNVISI
jgi:hypothetical protein